MGDDLRVSVDATERNAEIKGYESGFRSAGLPLLIEGYSPAEDIFNRAVPLLGLVLCLEVLAPLNASWSTIANVGVVLGAMLAQDKAKSQERGVQGPHFPAKAKSVIWLFMEGAPSAVDMFDPKPELTRRNGQRIDIDVIVPLRR